MTDKASKLSIRNVFLWTVMSVVTVSLAILSCLSLYMQIDNYRSELNNKAFVLSDFVARTSSQYIFNNKDEGIAKELGHLVAMPYVLNAHVYRKKNRQQANVEVPQIFASYNKVGQLMTGGKEAQLESLLLNPTISDTGDYLEVSTKSFDAETGIHLGWVYLRLSTREFNSLTQRAIFTHLAAVVILLIIAFYTAFKMQLGISNPIKSLTHFLQQTSRHRDYSSRASGSKIQELDTLANAINVMLYRMQEYMEMQQQAEERHRKLNSSLEEMVNERTTALKDANRELIQALEKLHQFQRQIVQNEKMASLGDMVAGVAHEVNTPIGLGVTASTMMLDRLAVIQKGFDDKTLKASAMKRFIDESNENLNIIYRNLNRAAELISSFKQVAVDQSTENSRSFCVEQLVNEILLSLQPRLKKLNHNINVKCDPTLSVETKAGPINQILINLIMNSVIHGFEFMDAGTINIRAELVSDDKLKLVYSDDGKGIPPEIRKRIFDPFVTTKRGQGGSGLGMHLVYNLVTQALLGSITLTSEEGDGVEFVIIFPVSDAKYV